MSPFIRPIFRSAALACLAFLTACSTPLTTTVNAEPEKTAIRPDTLELYVGGFFGPSYWVKLLPDGSLEYTVRIPPAEPKRSIIHVSDERWTGFRTALDKARVWKWKNRYENPDIMDGTQWNLKIGYPDTSISSAGSNAFPPHSQFKIYHEAVRELLDGRNFN